MEHDPSKIPALQFSYIDTHGNSQVVTRLPLAELLKLLKVLFAMREGNLSEAQYMSECPNGKGFVCQIRSELGSTIMPLPNFTIKLQDQKIFF
jgi:hypothetical protein